MKRYFYNGITFLLLISVLLVPVFADQYEYVIDNADILTDTEERVLNDGILRLQQIFSIDIVILTEPSLYGDLPQNHADSYYDSHGYQEDGILFLISMEEREWYISTCGDTIYALSDYGIQCIGEDMLPYLASGAYYDAFDTFLADLYDYLEAFRAGTPIDGFADYSGDYYHGDRENVLYYEEPFTPSFPLSLLIGLVIGLVTVLIMRSAMNTRRPQRTASEYMARDSFRVTGHQDLFLYSNISKVKKPQNNTGSHSGGGSSVHRSSGGRSHGGGGGKF